MSAVVPSKGDLKNVIHKAFKDAVRPERVHIIEHECWECGEVRDDFAEYDHDHVPAAILERHWASLPLFSAAALRYFLPSYLCYSLDHVRSGVTEHLIYQLSPSDVTSARWQERIGVFSEDERAAICKYLNYMGAYESKWAMADIQTAKRIWCTPR